MEDKHLPFLGMLTEDEIQEGMARFKLKVEENQRKVAEIRRLELGEFLAWLGKNLDIDSLSDDESNWLIEQAFEIGDFSEAHLMLGIFGHERVKNVLCRAEGLSRETLALACSLLDLEKDAFKCYPRILKENTPPWQGTNKKWDVPIDERRNIRPMLFWDVSKDEANLNQIIETNPYWLSPRVFEHGLPEEIDLVIKWYGKETIIESLLWADSLRRNAVDLACSMFSLEKEAFRCVKYKSQNRIPGYY